MTDVPIAEPDVGPHAIDRVQSVLESGQLADGPAVRSFERAFAKRCRVEHAIATSNGTTALHATLEALGVEDGDVVITSPFSFVASANAIRLAGGRPAFADIDPMTYTLDPAHVEAILSERDDVVGVLPVHLYGLSARMDRLQSLASDHDCFLLEDACQAHGATFDGQPVGSFGDAACFSFYPTKNVTTGEGGMVTTNRSEVADAVRQFINHGRPPSGSPTGYQFTTVGHNFRMTSLAAAIGQSQLRRLESFTRTRRENASIYDERLGKLPITTPTEPPDRRHVYHQYTIRSSERETLRDALAENGVETAIYYPTPIHCQPPYRTEQSNDLELPRAERAANEVLSIPVHPGVDEAGRDSVCSTIEAFYRDRP